ncbi:MAG: hypothetical protein JWN51_422 [Phycisphaerales bacterium]|nr:hypothetical protein [Phycisphaerales bacterium]
MNEPHQENAYVRRRICCFDPGLFRPLRHVHLRVRQIVNPQGSRTMENMLVGIVAIGLLLYLLAALIRPENF